MNIQELIDNVRAWGEAKGISGPNGRGTLLGQLSKTAEELTETRDAALALQMCSSRTRWEYKAMLQDGIGDTAITLILAAEMADLRFEECIAAAYDEIKGRTGTMQGGQFVKDA